MSNHYYAGIGSRETPAEVLQDMTRLASILEERGYILRSGGAAGADTAFARGCKYDTEIFIPWNNFSGLRAGGSIIDSSKLPTFQEAQQIAAKAHPAWHRCSPGAKTLHTRNVFQVMGADLVNLSRFIVCWTKDGLASGGTGQAIRIADNLGIPTYNFNEGTRTRSLKEMLATFNFDPV